VLHDKCLTPVSTYPRRRISFYPIAIKAKCVLRARDPFGTNWTKSDPQAAADGAREPLRQELAHVLGEVAAREVQPKNGVRESIALVDGNLSTM
jgi:hypothetical protein